MTAGAQFVAMIVLLKTTEAREFGSLVLLFGALQFAFGVTSAVICAPMLSQPVSRAAESVALFSSVNLALSALAATILGTATLALTASAPDALLFFVFAFASLQRWFLRAVSYRAALPLRVFISDALYAALLSIGIVGLSLSTGLSVGSALAVFGASAIAGVSVMPGLAGQLRDFSWRSFVEYREVWRGQSRFALLGVATTEASSNAQLYVLAALHGTEALALIGAASLLIRPMGLCMNGLTDLELPRMSRDLRMRRSAQIAVTIRQFRAALAAAWAASAVAATILLWVHPRLLFGPQYDLDSLRTAAALWFAIAAARAARAPESAFLQASGAFGPLAWASCRSAIVAIVFVSALAFAIGPVASLVGALVADLLLSAFVLRTAQSHDAFSQRRAR